MITVSNLYKSIDGHEILKDLSFNIGTGSIYGLIGRNGSGKTTVIKHLAGFYKPDSGDISYDGAQVWKNPSIKDKIGYIPDDLNSMLSYNMLNAARYLKGIYSDWDSGILKNLCEAFNLNMNLKFKDFSKGKRKQAAFALMFSMRPKYILLDEPIDGLDPIVRKIVWKVIKRAVSEFGTSVLVSSHNLREIENICDTVGIIEEGRMVMEQKLDNIKNNVHKVQLVLPEKADPKIKLTEAGIEILKAENDGSVSRIVIRGDKNEMKKKIEALDPVVFDVLPMTLEEIFIVEQEADHGVKDILV